jgi:hypothetical protein
MIGTEINKAEIVTKIRDTKNANTDSAMVDLLFCITFFLNSDCLD